MTGAMRLGQLLRSDLERYVARSAGDVEHPSPFGNLQLAHGERPPAPIDAEGQQTVEQIVAGSNGIKHVADAPPLFGQFVHGLASPTGSRTPTGVGGPSSYHIPEPPVSKKTPLAAGGARLY